MSIVSFTQHLGTQRAGSDTISRAREQKLQLAAEQFEALFLQQILKQMRKASDVLSDGNPMRSRELDSMRDFYDQALADTLSKRKQTGIADMLVAQLSPGALPDYEAAALAAREAELPARTATSFQEPIRSTWQRSRSESPWPVAQAANEPVDFKSLVQRVINQESDGRVDAVSPKGALGLMQLMPGTAQDMAAELGIEFDQARLTTDADYNMQLGTAYLQRMLQRYDGSPALALAAYNAGPGKVDEWLQVNGDPRTGEIGEQAWIARIPYQETRDYARKILAAMDDADAPAREQAAVQRAESQQRLASALSADSGVLLSNLASQQLNLPLQTTLKSDASRVALNSVTRELSAEGDAAARLPAFAQPVRLER
ncbi:transglycosylase SLT domain-containing protein [Ectopseudomonas mendocina]|uniref:Transglycosylase SLT domain-containing protein n=1 Tax=Ectopseudomonas mendocina TaxID=300 RepID=A0ABZ2RMZ4_ECTME